MNVYDGRQTPYPDGRQTNGPQRRSRLQFKRQKMVDLSGIRDLAAGYEKIELGCLDPIERVGNQQTWCDP